MTGVLAGWRSPTAAREHATGAVLTPERVAGKSNQRSRPCLSWLQLPSTSAVDIVRRGVLLSFS